MTHRTPNKTIKVELERRKIRQVQAALDLKIPASRFNLIANGFERPGPKTRKKIADYLQLPESRVFDLSADERHEG